MQNEYEASPSIILAIRGLLVKILIPHELIGIFYLIIKFCIFQFKIVWPLVYNSGTALTRDTDCSSIYSLKPLNRACIARV